MAGKLSGAAASKVAELQGLSPKVARLNALIETLAVAQGNLESQQASLKRAAGQLKLNFMGVGYDQLSQLCGSIALASSRSGNAQSRVRTLRELVGSLKFQLEMSIKSIIRDDEQARSKSETNDA